MLAKEKTANFVGGLYYRIWPVSYICFNFFTVSAISFSISGRILSLYFDKSAVSRQESILGMYRGFAAPTSAKAFMHCLAVIGFSSVMCDRYSSKTASKRFSSSHWAFAAKMYSARLRTRDFGWLSREATSSKYSYQISLSLLSAMTLSANARDKVSFFDVSFWITLFSLDFV